MTSTDPARSPAPDLPGAARGLLGALAMEEATTEEAGPYIAWHRERIRRTAELVRACTAERARILDVGAGPLTSELVGRLRPREVHVLDPAARWSEEGAVPGARFHVGSLADPELPFAPETFDAVLAAEVFEHLTECPRHIVPRIARIVRPGGVLIVTTPNQARWLNRVRLLLGVNIQELPENLFHKGWMGYGHIREFTIAEYPGEFGVSGLRAERVGGWSPHPMPRGDLVRRIVDRVGPPSLDQVLYGVFRKPGPPDRAADAPDAPVRVG